MPSTIVLAVLAGGQGKRFGKPKILARLPWGETALHYWSRTAETCAGMGWRPYILLSSHVLPLARAESGPPPRLKPPLHPAGGPMLAVARLLVLKQPTVLVVSTIDQLGPGCSGLAALAEAAARVEGSAIPLCGEPYYTPLAVYRPGQATELIMYWLRGSRTRLTDLARVWGRLALTPLPGSRRGMFASFNRPAEVEGVLDPSPCPQGGGAVVEAGGLERALRLLGGGLRAEAARLFEAEASAYMGVGLRVLSAHALDDARRVGGGL